MKTRRGPQAKLDEGVMPEKMRLFLQEHDLSINRLADIADIKHQTLRDNLTGVTKMFLDTAIRLEMAMLGIEQAANKPDACYDFWPHLIEVQDFYEEKNS